MNCDFVPTSAHHATTGVQVAACKRRGCGQKMLMTFPLDKLHSNCRGWPFAHEVGHWVALLLEVIGISKTRWAWIRWKLGLQEPGGCDKCEEYQAWLNTRGGNAVMAWRRFKAWLWRHD